jgi:hypothetical protein
MSIRTKWGRMSSASLNASAPLAASQISVPGREVEADVLTSLKMNDFAPLSLGGWPGAACPGCFITRFQLDIGKECPYIPPVRIFLTKEGNTHDNQQAYQQGADDHPSAHTGRVASQRR